MGDKSPKAKQKGQQQKNAAKAGDAAALKSKQDSHNRAPQVPGVGKKK